MRGDEYVTEDHRDCRLGSAGELLRGEAGAQGGGCALLDAGGFGRGATRWPCGPGEGREVACAGAGVWLDGGDWAGGFGGHRTKDNSECGFGTVDFAAAS